jgi:hypothetical protein
MSLSPETVDQIFDILQWVIGIAAGAWLVTSVISVFHRRAYNLTHAESGGSKKIRPDFLTVDKDKRDAAIKRGEKYDEELARRERVAAGSPGAVASAGHWSAILAQGSAWIGVGFAALTTLTRIAPTDKAIRELGRWETFEQIVREHQVGAILSVLVIAASFYTMYDKSRKPGGK